MVSDVVGTDLSQIPPTADNGLINGRGQFNCSQPSYSNSTQWLGSNLSSNLTWTCVDGAERAKFRFQSGKIHRLRLMNTGADGIQKFSIDGHTMTVVATDYVPTKPYDAEVITLGVGQRTDVLVTGKSDPKASYWMRSELPGGPFCGGEIPPGSIPPGVISGLAGPPPSPSGNVTSSRSLSPRQAPAAASGVAIPSGLPAQIAQAPPPPPILAAIYYEQAEISLDPITTASASAANDTSCSNDALTTTQPTYPITPHPHPHIENILLTLALNATGSFEWRINNQTFRADFNSPILYSAASGKTSFPNNPEWNVYNFGSARSIVLNVTNQTPFYHPFHLHGHTFYVLSTGKGIWDGSTSGNPSNPMRRDVQIVPAGGYTAIQFEADNPGVWPFHCHVAWHLSGGLGMNVMTRPEAIRHIPRGERGRTCRAWDQWTGREGRVVDQIDSGS